MAYFHLTASYERILQYIQYVPHVNDTNSAFLVLEYVVY